MYPWNIRINNAISRLNALAHEGRLELFRRLVQAGPQGVAAGALATAAGVNFTTASAQLSVLANAGLVTNRREGRSIIYQADFEKISALIAFLMEDCCQGRREIIAPIADLASKAASCDSSKGDIQ